MKRFNCKNLIYIVFAVAFLIMLMFNLMTPMAGDDFAHYFGVNGEHATSLNEIISNLAVFRNETNGRVIAHFFVYLFLIPPRFIFSFLNAINTAGIIYLVYCFYKGEENEKNLSLLLISIFLIWIFMPGFGEVFLWFTGSINYSWALTIYLIFLIPFYRSFMDDAFIFNAGVLSIIGFVGGAYSENGAVAAISVSFLFIVAIWVNRKSFPIKLFFPFLSTCMGFIFLMTAPSELGTRAGDFSFNAVWKSMLNCIRLTFNYCKWLFIFFIILLIIAIILKKNSKIIVASVIFFLGGIASIMVFSFAVYIARRSFYILVTFDVIAILLLLSDLYKVIGKKTLYAFTGVLLIIFGYRFAIGTYDISKLHLQYCRRMDIVEKAKESGNNNVVFHEYTTGTPYSEIMYEELEEDPDWWYNKLLARYFGLESVAGIKNK